MAIQKLPSINQLAAGDQMAVYSQALGNDARAPLSLLASLMAPLEGVPTALADLTSLYTMRLSTPVSVPVTTTAAPIPNWDSPPLVMPEGRSALTPMTAQGVFVAQRDIAACLFFVSLVGAWANNRDLTLQILAGTDAAPYTSSFQFVAAGRGASLVTANIAGAIANLLNPGNIIKAGEKIRLSVSSSGADTLSITRAAMVLLPLDGP